jgi:transcriptional regulator with XRE-family HTH domain
MSMTWKRLKDKRYREEFAIAMLKRMIPFQTRAIRKKRGWSQAKLAEEARVTQGVISRAEDPDYGNLTLTTIGRIAAGYDLAAIVKFVPFGELKRYSEGLSEKEFADLPTFAEENSRSESEEQNVQILAALGAPNVGSSSIHVAVAQQRETKSRKTRVRRETQRQRRRAVSSIAGRERERIYARREESTAGTIFGAGTGTTAAYRGIQA